MNREMLPDNRGYFGAYGGRFVPEVLIPALDELVAAFGAARNDPSFQNKFASLSARYSGRQRRSTSPNGSRHSAAARKSC